MIKTIIKLGLFLVVGILIYNYFLGTPEEKETSAKIFSEIKDVGKSIGQLIKNEREKFDKGKYDNALDKIGNLFESLKSKAKSSSEWMDRLRNLELRKENIRKKLETNGDEGPSASEQKELKEEMEELIKQTEELAKDMENQ